jgi:hypothetical protein
MKTINLSTRYDARNLTLSHVAAHDDMVVACSSGSPIPRLARMMKDRYNPLEIVEVRRDGEQVFHKATINYWARKNIYECDEGIRTVKFVPYEPGEDTLKQKTDPTQPTYLKGA